MSSSGKRAGTASPSTRTGSNRHRITEADTASARPAPAWTRAAPLHTVEPSNREPAVRTVFLDLDGTLTDPKPGITRSIRHALTGLGVDAPEEDALTWCIGPPLAQVFEVLLDDAARVPRAIDLFRERFGAVGLYENRVYDGVPEMLERLADAGFRLALATSKPHVYARRIVEHFGLDRWVGPVFGAELDGTRSDKAALLAHALEQTGCAPGRAVMLGDREHDVRGALANDLPCVGAAWGYGGAEELRAAGAVALAADPEEAAAHVLRMARAEA